MGKYNVLAAYRRAQVYRGWRLVYIPDEGSQHWSAIRNGVRLRAHLREHLKIMIRLRAGDDSQEMPR